MYQQKITEASYAIIVFDAVYADFEIIKSKKFEIVFCYLEMYFHNELGTLRILICIVTECHLEFEVCKLSNLGGNSSFS